MNTYAYIAVSGEQKILTYQMTPENGKLQLLRELTLDGAPGPLAVHPRRRRLYAGLRSTRQIVSFRISPQGAHLSPFGEAVSLDGDPCYLSTDRRGRFLLSAFYGAGKVMVHRIGGDGAVENDPVGSYPTADHAHCITTDPYNRFAFVPHTVEPNLIRQFEFDAETGRLTPNRAPVVIADAGAGPRHYVFHPADDFVYFSNEQGCSVTAYRFDADGGTLAPLQTLSTLPAGYSGENTCAQIHIHPSGRFLYVSNRGHNSIAGFAIDEVSGFLTAIGQQPTEPIPRAFGLDPDGRYLYAAGQGSGRLAAYQVDGQTGEILPVGVYPVGDLPMWVLLLELPG